MLQRSSPSFLSLSSSNSRLSLPPSNLNQMPTSIQCSRRRRSIRSALHCLKLKILSCKTLFHQFGTRCIISRIIITNQFYLERERNLFIWTSFSHYFRNMELSAEEINSLINKFPSGETESFSKQYLIHIRSFVLIRRNLKRIAQSIPCASQDQSLISSDNT